MVCGAGGVRWLRRYRAAAGLRTLAFSGSAGGNTGKRLAGSVDRGSYRYGGRDCGGCVFRLYQCSYILFRHKEIALDLRRYKKNRAADAAPKNTELHHPRVGCGATGGFFMPITADIQPKMFFCLFACEQFISQFGRNCDKILINMQFALDITALRAAEAARTGRA